MNSTPNAIKWVAKSAPQATQIAHLVQELRIPTEIATLLLHRGITTFEEARTYFRPEESTWHDPFLMKDMESAVGRLLRAINKGEKVMVYGDYDVDGTTSVTMMDAYLARHQVPVTHFLPSRFKEGYGLTQDGIDQAIEQEIQLMITVDCGITAVEEVKQLQEAGVDVIVCDHHEPGEHLPPAVAVLDPKRADCPYPFSELSGAGVTYKLIEATRQRLGEPEDVTESLLDLLAVSISADIVSLRDENRWMMHKGLTRLNERPRPGFQALMKTCKATPGFVRSSTIAFSMGPRINAAGRMGNAFPALELLMARTDEEAMSRATALEQINKERKLADKTTLQQAMDQVAERGMQHDPTLVLFGENWHLGVLGIVASRLVEEYQRPVFLLSQLNGQAKGSARSVPGIHLVRLLEEVSDTLERYGGHASAAGLALDPLQIERFRERVNEAMVALPMEPAEQMHEYDAELQLKQITPKFWSLYRQMEPFGPDNPVPRFITRGIRLAKAPVRFGANHAKGLLMQAEDPERAFEAISFSNRGIAEALQRAWSLQRPMDILWELEESNYGGKRVFQLRLVDVKLTS